MTQGAEHVRKVAAVLVLDGASGPEVLVFEHPQEGGGTHRQLPAGTVESGESPEAAAVRELIEETGVLGVVEALVGVVGDEFEGEARRRWVYVMRSLEDGLDEWPFEWDCGAAVRMGAAGRVGASGAAGVAGRRARVTGTGEVGTPRCARRSISSRPPAL